MKGSELGSSQRKTNLSKIKDGFHVLSIIDESLGCGQGLQSMFTAGLEVLELGKRTHGINFVTIT